MEAIRPAPVPAALARAATVGGLIVRASSRDVRAPWPGHVEPQSSPIGVPGGLELCQDVHVVCLSHVIDIFA